MAYKIKNTGGSFNLPLFDLNGAKVDVTGLTDVVGTWKNADGTSNALITIAANAGNDYDAVVTFAPGYVVTGTLTPAATGEYKPAGTHNSATYYQYDIWKLYRYLDTGVWRWVISSTLDDVSGVAWLNSAVDTLVGTFNPNENATGNATVALSTISPLGSATILLESTTTNNLSIQYKPVEIEVMTEEAYNNYFSATDTQSIISKVDVVDGNVDDIESKVDVIDGNVDDIETKTDSIITGINTLGSRSINVLIADNNQLIPT